MYIIMGATGHVGSATALSLLADGNAVGAVTRKAEHAVMLAGKGAKIVEADLSSVSSLRAALSQGKRAFLLNPPADTTLDTDMIERRTVANILSALEGSSLEKVVAESTGGARHGSRIGDLSVLFELEEGLKAQSIPAAINRAAYYMSNWDAQLDAIRAGKLTTMFPADLVIPMVAPGDLGKIAARRLVSAVDDVGIKYVEGPKRYSPADVARIFSEALHRPVDIVVIPQPRIKEAFRALGFSEGAADSYARMTKVSIEEGFDMPTNSIRGQTTLEAYVQDLLRRQISPAIES